MPKEIRDAIHEMNLFVLSQKGISYYDVKNYALLNDKRNWLLALKNKSVRTGISELCRSKRKKDNVPYNTFFGEPYTQ